MKKKIKKRTSFPKNKEKERKIDLKEKITPPRIKTKIIGLGGGGSTIINEIAQEIPKVSFIAANTDLRALQKIKSPCQKFVFGQELTQGLGTGMDVQLGEKAALSQIDKIKRLFNKTDLVILIACLGGGTGSGALPVFALAAKNQGSKILGIFTFPFKFEGEKKMNIAKQSLEKALPHLHGTIVINNENIFKLVDKKTPLKEALSTINKNLTKSIGSLIQIFSTPGFINIDFIDLKTILEGPEKKAYLNSQISENEQAEKIAQTILKNPLYLEPPQFPKKVLLHLTAGKDLKISEVEKISQKITNLNPKAKIIFGLSIQKKFEGKIKTTLLYLGEEKQTLLKKVVQKEKLARSLKIKPGTEKVKKEIKNQDQSKEKEPKKEKEIAKKTIGRRNALDLKKEAKKFEKELLEQEQKWDTPAFLRRKNWQISSN